MKRKSKIFGLFFLISSNLIAQDLQIEVKLEKNIYLVREPIVLLVKLTNRGSIKCYIDNLSMYNGNSGISLLIYDLQNNQVPRMLRTQSSERKILKSGESFYKTISIIPLYYANEFENTPVAIPDGYIKEGSYNLKTLLKWTNYLNKNKKTFQSISNEITFEVIKSTKIVDQKLIKEYDGIISKYYNYKFTNKNHSNDLEVRTNKKMEILINDNPESKYCKLIYRKLLNRQKFFEKEKRDEIIRAFINKYPNSFMSMQYISRIGDIKSEKNIGIINAVETSSNYTTLNEIVKQKLKNKRMAPSLKNEEHNHEN